MGRLLDQRYDIQSEIGRGTFAATYLADDRQTGRRCVVKLLSLRQLDSPKTHELFEREARVLANLQHPRIPRFMGYFEEEVEGDLALGLVQEHVEGTDLARLVAQGRRFDEPEAVRIGIELARILEHLHGLSPALLHRDIKPSNVLLTGTGDVYLVDFGAVRDKVRNDPLLRTGLPTVVGTFGYMPLEQFEGQAVPASDLYALGATLLHITSGKNPWELEKDGLRLQVRPHVPVSRGFARLLERLLEPDWRDRPSSATAVREELERLLPPSRTTPRRRSGRRAVALALALVLALLAVPSLPRLPSIGHGPRTARERVSPALATVAATAVPPEPAPGPVWSGSERDANGDPQPPSALRRLGAVRLRHGAAVTGVAYVQDGRSLATSSLDRTVSVWDAVTGRERHRFDVGEAVLSLAASPDGARIAAGLQRWRSAYLWDAVSGKVIARLRVADVGEDYEVRHVAFSRDGRRLATLNRTSLDLWDGRTGVHLQRLEGCPSSVGGLAFLPSGDEWLVTCNGTLRRRGLDGRDTLVSGQAGQEPPGVSLDGRLAAVGPLLWNLADNRLLRRLASYPDRVTTTGLSPSGTELVVGFESGAIVVEDAASGERRAVMTGHVGAVLGLAFSADGRRLASAGADGHVRRWDAHTGAASDAPAGHQGSVLGLSFAPSGETLLSAGADARLRAWGRDGTLRDERELGRDVRGVYHLSDSRVLAVAPDRFHVFDVESGWEIREQALPEDRRERWHVAVAPRAGRLAAAGVSSITVWDLDRGREHTFTVPAPEEPAAFSPDGRILATLREGPPHGYRILVLRHAEDGRLIGTTPPSIGGPRAYICRAEDGSFLLFNAVLWRVWSDSRPHLQYVGAHRGDNCTATADGRLVAFRHFRDEAVELYALKPGRDRPELVRVAWLQGHRGAVTALAFARDARTLASGGADGNVLLWDVAALRALGERRPPPPAPPLLAAAPPSRGDAPRVHLSFEGEISGAGIDTVREGPTSSRRFVPGVVGQALRLSAPLDFPETRRILLGAAHTLTFWFRIPDSEAVRAAPHTQVIQAAPWSVDVRNPREGGTKEALLFYHFANEGGHGNVKLADWSGAFEIDRWYHVGVAYRREAGSRICIDGVCRDHATGPYMAEQVGTLELGGRRGGDADVDELFIWDRAQGDDEIAAAARRTPVQSADGPRRP